MESGDLRAMFRELSANNPLLNRYDFIFSFDTEFTRGCYLNVIPDDRNGVVSYQATLLHVASGEIIQVKHTTTTARQEARLGLEAFIGRAMTAAIAARLTSLDDIRGLRNSRGEARKLRIAICAHFSRADVGGFRNYGKIKSSFDMVRGTFVSIERPANAELPLMNGSRIDATLDLYDTILLAPDKFRSLEKIGGLLGFHKLKLPSVIDENGEEARGIERMDLCLRQHTEEFWLYALRDSEVALAFLLQFARHAQNLGLRTIPKTVASSGVATFKNMVGIETLAALTGRAIDERGRLADLLPEHLNILTTLADAYLGGRNECFEVGDIIGDFLDIDLKGAYVAALGFIRPMDWDAIEHTRSLDRLAQLDEPSVARIDFEFPAGTTHPCLAVYAGGEGLLYPLRGSTTVIGPELHLARRMGCKIKVRAGVRIPWASEDRPFVEYAIGVNRGRATATSKLFEQLEKTRGNSLYGKTGQAVGSFKSDPQLKRIFSSRRGRSEELPSSALTSPIIAAYASGICRATVSEIVWMLARDGAELASVTTDGILGRFTREAADRACQGDLARLFSQLRVLVDAEQSPEVIEIKHTATRVISIKTRGAIGVESTMRNAKGEIEYLLARAGHRLSVEPDDDADDVRQFAEIYRNRTPETQFYRGEFISPRAQYYGGGDLIETYRVTAAALDYDLKREPINIRDEHGLIRFETRPWRDIQEFRDWRERFDKWRKAAPAVLKVAADWDAFLTWRANGCPRKESSRLSPLMGAIRVAVAHKLPGFDGLWRGPGYRRPGDNRPSKREAIRDIADAMGERLTERMIENDARFATDPRLSPVDKIISTDAAKVCALAPTIPTSAIETLLTERARGVLRAQIYGPEEAPKMVENPESRKGLLYSGTNYKPPSQDIENGSKKPLLDDLKSITVKMPNGGEVQLREYSGPEMPPPTEAPARPKGPLDESDRAHLAAIDEALSADHKIGPMTIRKARDFLAHEERQAAKGRAAAFGMAPTERLVATRVIALAMKYGYGREQATAVFIEIAERARQGLATAQRGRRRWRRK
jgi:hypothetical protein